MIEKNDAIPLLLEAAPGIQSTWEAHLDYWGEDERGLYNDAAVFAHYIVDAFESGDTSEFQAIFGTIERLIREGDDDARGLAIVGVLEDIGTISSHRSFGQDPFVQWLGPLSRRAWQEIDELWRAGGGSTTGVLRLELHASFKEAKKDQKKWWQFWK